MTATAMEVPCPKCGGRTWDNRATKKNPKQPDFKCRDKSCDGVIWPPRNGSPAPQQSSPYQSPSYTSPGAPDFLKEQVAHEAATVAGIQHGAANKLQSLFSLYDVCLDHAIQAAASSKLPAETVPAMAATLFIAAKDRGLAA